MITKTITYKDFNGVDRKETFYFNLSDDEIIEMELGTNGGFSNIFRQIIEARDQESLIREFKKFILKAYGEKSQDGRRFIKSDELSKAFSETPAYTELFMELAFDDIKAAEFIKGLIPDEVFTRIQARIDAANKDKQTQLEIVDANLNNN